MKENILTRLLKGEISLSELRRINIALGLLTVLALIGACNVFAQDNPKRVVYPTKESFIPRLIETFTPTADLPLQPTTSPTSTPRPTFTPIPTHIVPTKSPILLAPDELDLSECNQETPQAVAYTYQVGFQEFGPQCLPIISKPGFDLHFEVTRKDAAAASTTVWKAPINIPEGCTFTVDWKYTDDGLTDLYFLGDTGSLVFLSLINPGQFSETYYDATEPIVTMAGTVLDDAGFVGPWDSTTVDITGVRIQIDVTDPSCQPFQK